jgi:hypothetical protein
MAFGNSSGRDYPEGTEFYSFSIKTKNLPEPLFFVSKKGADGKYAPVLKKDEAGNNLLDKDGKVIPLTAKRISGALTSASPKKGQHEGKDIHSVNLVIEDTTKEGVLQVYYLSVGETFIGRNLYNSLLALQLPADDIEIGLYQSKPKAGQTKTYASVALRQNNQLVKGVYDPKGDEMPKVKKVRLKGEDVSDTGDLDEWFRVKMTAWCKAVNAAPAKKISTTASSTHAEEEAVHAGAPAGVEDDHGEPPF